jgi:hypothetical protein
MFCNNIPKVENQGLPEKISGAAVFTPSLSLIIGLLGIGIQFMKPG